jgi:hypothetical protein
VVSRVISKVSGFLFQCMVRYGDGAVDLLCLFTDVEDQRMYDGLLLGYYRWRDKFVMVVF